MERAYKNYLEEVRSEVAALVYSDGEGASFEDKFTEYCIENLESIGKTDGARVLSFVHPNSKGGVEWKINGYCLKDSYKDDSNKAYFETLELFVSYYDHGTYDYNISALDFTKSLNQLKKFLNGALKNQIDYIDTSNNELNELVKIIGSQNTLFDRINVYFLINGTSIQKAEKASFGKSFENLSINFHIWDLPRFFRVNQSNSIREPIEIDFTDYLEDTAEGVQCLQVPIKNEIYDCYLAILPGNVLARLYKEYSNELLESNVRAFLGQAGKYNKGIRDTIRSKPEMFLPYNNGITATADNVETITIGNQLYIKKLFDFQVVNGGQTTASLYHTQKKYKDALLDNVSVQMKLTVIRDIDQKNIEVPNIARYANSQNKVTELDLSSNNPFFVQIENLSRKKYVVNPENRNQSLLWYFERVKGQYRETINKQTFSVQKRFKEQNPTKLKFVKSDIAKYMNLWNLKPFMVARGSQKNFIDYTKSINVLVEKNKLPGDNFYKNLIGNAMIFKSIDQLFGRKNVNAIGDTNLKSYTVAYTVSYFHFITQNRLDLWKIYNSQIIDESLVKEFKRLLLFVYGHLIKNAANTLISEYAKKELSWENLKKENYKIDIQRLESNFIGLEEIDLRAKEKEISDTDADDTIFLISEIKKLGLKFWDGCKLYASRENIHKIDFHQVFDLTKKIKANRNLNSQDLNLGKKVLSLLNDYPSLIHEIKNLSKLQEENSIEIKAVYDRLKQLSGDDWKRIIELGEQTKSFSYQESSNVKIVSRKMLKKETIKEMSLVKCYDSLEKLKKYGIKY